MNERIQELMKQSMVEHQFDLRFSPEKFAELIVRECVMCMYRRGVEGFGMLEERMLEEHFGVKE